MHDWLSRCRTCWTQLFLHHAPCVEHCACLVYRIIQSLLCAKIILLSMVQYLLSADLHRLYEWGAGVLLVLIAPCKTCWELCLPFSLIKDFPRTVLVLLCMMQDLSSALLALMSAVRFYCSTMCNLLIAMLPPQFNASVPLTSACSTCQREKV